MKIGKKCEICHTRTEKLLVADEYKKEVCVPCFRILLDNMMTMFEVKKQTFSVPCIRRGNAKKT